MPVRRARRGATGVASPGEPSLLPRSKIGAFDDFKSSLVSLSQSDLCEVLVIVSGLERTMYPDLSKIEQSEDRPPSVGIGFALPSDPSDDPKRRLLEASIDSIRALKGFIAQYDRVKEERDQLKRQMADRLDEVETLRDEIQQLKAQRDEFSNTLSTLVSQMGTAVRKAQRFIDIHVSNRNRRWFPAFRNDEGGQLQADLKLVENAPATPTDWR